MKNLSDSEKVEFVQEYGRQTMGSHHMHYAPQGDLAYTDGIDHLAEVCGAYWLVDLVASHQAKMRERHRGLALFQVWELAEYSDGLRISAWSDTPRMGPSPDGPGSVCMAEQFLEYSDFPKGLLPFTFWVEDGIALLKEEH